MSKIVRQIVSTILVTAQDSQAFQLALNTALNDLDQKGLNVADIRYSMGCHGHVDGEGVMSEYTALILVGG